MALIILFVMNLTLMQPVRIYVIRFVGSALYLCHIFDGLRLIYAIGCGVST